MASGIQKGLGGAASGAATGAMVGGPWGAVIGGGIGLLGGLFSGDDPEAPKLSDVDLSRDNPDLWNELQNIQALEKEYSRLYAQRQQGPLPSERAAIEQGRANLGEQLATRGMVGSSAAASQLGAYNNQAMDSVQRRAFEQQQQLLAAQQAASLARSNGIMQGTGQALGQNNFGYNANLNEQESRNQFLSSMVNNGLAMYGNQQYMDKVGGMPSGSYNGPYPGYQGPQIMARGYAPSYYSGPQGNNSYGLGMPSNYGIPGYGNQGGGY